MRLNKEDEYKTVQYLRFRKIKPCEASETFMTLKNIAKFINRSETYVHNLCKKMVEESKHSDQPTRMLTRKIFK